MAHFLFACDTRIRKAIYKYAHLFEFLFQSHAHSHSPRIVLSPFGKHEIRNETTATITLRTVKNGKILQSKAHCQHTEHRAVQCRGRVSKQTRQAGRPANVRFKIPLAYFFSTDFSERFEPTTLITHTIQILRQLTKHSNCFTSTLVLLLLPLSRALVHTQTYTRKFPQCKKNTCVLSLFQLPLGQLFFLLIK